MVTFSVIIPSFNRYDAAKIAVNAALSQRFLEDVQLEVILINDCSSDERYYARWPKGCTVIHLARSSRDVLGYPCVAYVRNCGIRVSRGDYLAFCDDDDAFHPDKLQKQLTFMRQHGALFSCTEAVMGQGSWLGDEAAFQRLPKFNARFGTTPLRVTAKMMRKRNHLINSAVVVHKSLLNRVGLFNEEHEMGKFHEDWDLWQRCGLCYWLDEPLLYYDLNHGGGVQHYDTSGGVTSAGSFA